MRKIYERHGLADNHRLYSIWKSMRTRCNNPNSSRYKDYGGRGIKICDRWDSFLSFVEDMYPSFKEGLTLDRKENDGDYTPDNCKWSTEIEQHNNQSSNILIFFNGELFTEAELHRKTGVPRTTIQSRRKRGASPEEMIHGFERI